MHIYSPTVPLHYVSSGNSTTPNEQKQKKKRKRKSKANKKDKNQPKIWETTIDKTKI